MQDFLEARFHLRERGTTAVKELACGLKTSLIVMCFFVVTTRILSRSFSDATVCALYFATAMSTCLGTLVVGLLANLPHGSFGLLRSILDLLCQTLSVVAERVLTGWGIACFGQRQQ